MTLHARVVTVTTEPTLLTLPQADGAAGSSLAVSVPAAGQIVYFGGPDVTVASGYPCAPGSEHFVDLEGYPGAPVAAEDGYAIVAATTQAVNVLQAAI